MRIRGLGQRRNLYLAEPPTKSSVEAPQLHPITRPRHARYENSLAIPELRLPNAESLLQEFEHPRTIPAGRAFVIASSYLAPTGTVDRHALQLKCSVPEGARVPHCRPGPRCSGVPSRGREHDCLCSLARGFHCCRRPMSPDWGCNSVFSEQAAKPTRTCNKPRIQSSQRPSEKASQQPTTTQRLTLSALLATTRADGCSLGHVSQPKASFSPQRKM